MRSSIPNMSYPMPQATSETATGDAALRRSFITVLLRPFTQRTNGSLIKNLPYYHTKHFRKPGSVLCDHLSRAQITLRFKLPLYPGRETLGSHHGIAPDKVYTADGVTIVPVSSYLAFSPLPCGGCFLLHYLGSHLRRTLSVILSRGSPDFPQTSPFV